MNSISDLSFDFLTLNKFLKIILLEKMNSIGVQAIEDLAKIARLVPMIGSTSASSQNAVYKQVIAYGDHETTNPTR